MFQGSTDGQNPKPALNALDGLKHPPLHSAVGEKTHPEKKKNPTKDVKRCFCWFVFLDSEG